MFILLTTWLLGYQAFAQPLNVVAGDDLIAWQAIDEKQLDDEQLAAAYHLFMTRYPTSALSEVAHGRLQALNPEGLGDSPLAMDETQQSWIAESHQLHRDRLTQDLASSTIVTLTADGSVPAPKPSPWQGAFHAGAAWMGDTPYGVTGVQLRYRPIGVMARVGLGASPYLEGGLRLTAPGWGPFAEVNADTRGGLAVLAGGRYALKHKFWLELSGGAQQVHDVIGPAIRLELVKGL